MQAGGLGLLIAAAAPVAASSARDSEAEESASASGAFSTLLDESGAQLNSDTQEQAGGGELPSDVVPNALLAQDLSADSVASNVSASELLKEEISSEDAEDLLLALEEYEAANPPQSNAEAQLNADLKAALSEIAQGGDAQTVGEMLAQLPSLVAAPQGGRSLLVNKALDAMQLAHAKLQGAKIAAALEENNAQLQAEEDTASLSLLESLQAGHFRRDARKMEAADSETRDAEKASEAAALALAGTSVAVPVLATQLPIVVQEQASWDATIAPLALPKEEPSLPEVTLPSVTDAEQLAVQEEAQADSQMQALSVHEEMLLSDVQQENFASDERMDAANSVLLGQGLHGRHGATGVQTPHAVLPSAYVLNHAPVAEQVHVAITRATEEGGGDSLTIQLDPVELGRVEVKMQTGADGQTYVSFLVDKADTLDALARDARGLERSLQEAGIKADAGGMQFNLRQQPQSQAGFDQQGSGQSSQRQARNDEDAPAIASAATAAASLTRHYTLNLRDGVNIQA